MTTLYIDYKHSGHHIEYLSHLIEFTSTKSKHRNKHHFLIKEEAIAKLPPFSDNVVVTPLRSGCITANNALFELIPYTKNNDIQKVVFLDINPFQSILALRKLPENLQFSGILFHPVYRTKWSFKNALRVLTKNLVLYMICKAQQCESIYILNDRKACRGLNKRFKTAVFKALPDPIPFDNIHNTTEKTHPAKNLRRKFLVFGSLSARKGIFRILKALDFIPTNIHPRIEINFIGKIQPQDEFAFKHEFESTKIRHPNVRLTLENAFVDDFAMTKAYASTDWILAPYTRIEGSSGSIGLAASFKKPIIVSAGGLLEEIVIEYSLGHVINNDTELTQAIANATTHPPPRLFGVEQYISLNNKADFARTLTNESINR